MGLRIASTHQQNEIRLYGKKTRNELRVEFGQKNAQKISRIDSLLPLLDGKMDTRTYQGLS